MVARLCSSGFRTHSRVPVASVVLMTSCERGQTGLKFHGIYHKIQIANPINDYISIRTEYIVVHELGTCMIHENCATA